MARPWRGWVFLLISLILLASLPQLQPTPSGHGIFYSNYAGEVQAGDSNNQFSGGANGIEATLPRVMDRVEGIRELKFKEAIPVEAINRSEYTRQYLNMTGNVTEEFWELAQQEYEALYILDEGTNARREIESFYTTAVLGFYDAERNQIVVVNGSGELDEVTLAHELDHALLDQYYPHVFETSSDLTDDSSALSALIEGDANLVEEEYLDRFGRSAPTGGATEGGSSASPSGFTMIQIFPYLEGVNFVAELKQQRGGWGGVNGAYEDLPPSTEQIIHVERYGIDAPTEVHVANRTAEGWQFVGRDTLGEFVIFTMFWSKHQVAMPTKASTGRPTYLSNLSDGWDGDDMAIYKWGEGRYGYLWEIVWDSAKDAEEFIRGYEDMLLTMDATSTEDIWRIDANDFVKLWQEGRVVVIVNAPSREEIFDVYRPLGHVYYTVTFDAPDGATLTIDDVTYNPQNPPTSLLWQEGSIHTFSIAPETISRGGGIREVFSQWSDGSNATERAVTADDDRRYTAKFKTQYYLKVDSPYGDPQGEGWYDAGATATFSVTSPSGPLRQNIFAGWSGDTTATAAIATILMDSPKRAVANWSGDYTPLPVIALSILIAGGIILGIIWAHRRKAKNASISL